MTRFRKSDWATHTQMYPASYGVKLPAFMRPTVKERAKPRKLEEGLQKTCADWLNLKGYLWWHTPNAGGGYGTTPGARAGYMAKMKRLGTKPGVPDIMILRNGTLYMAELKAPKGVVSDEQKRFMLRAESEGAVCAVVRSLEQLQALLALPKPLTFKAWNGMIDEDQI